MAYRKLLLLNILYFTAASHGLQEAAIIKHLHFVVIRSCYLAQNFFLGIREAVV
jgi:hypothetical protein